MSKMKTAEQEALIRYPIQIMRNAFNFDFDYNESERNTFIEGAEWAISQYRSQQGEDTLVSKAPESDKGEVEKQPFQNFPELALHIERMASTGQTGSGSDWCAFLNELNNVCSLKILSNDC